ncbi:MAG: 50S ribosomal protein L10, partial [Candidatus Subteraquimicrobiales bacterium]|nr:50S ribosomal protein L10 [Candidatus Subteraquimicrobiales bacterium]
LESLDSYLIGPTGIAFAKGDFLSFLKALNEISKKYECFEAKAGLVDGEILDASKLKILANLPSREELIAKLVGTLKSPLSNVVNTLVSPIRGLVYLLNSAAQQK